MSESQTSKRLGAAIRRQRVKAGLSQEELAEQAGLHTTYISMVERGIRNPTVDVAARIAKALRISLPRLIALAERGLGKAAKASRK